MASAQADIVAALRSLVSVEVPEVVAEVQASRLALSAGLGGLVAGGIVGFVFSGLLGGGWGVAVLASALGSTWAVGTGGRWLDAKGARLLHPVTRWIVHPVTKWIGGILPATPGTPSEAEVRRALEAAWESAVDLAFAECLLHPDRLDPQSARSAAPYVETAPIGLDQITELMALLRAESVDRDEIVETVRDLAQEFAHAGWSWRWIDRGTPYEDKFAESFERVGLLRDGEPVVSRRAAVFRSGKLLRRGLLTRMQ
jgi:hypothetical protein